MSLLEIFVHGGCLSEQPAVALAEELRKEFPTWMVQVVDNRDRAEHLGLLVLPAFVLNGKVLAVGVPRKEWLFRQLRECVRPTR